MQLNKNFHEALLSIYKTFVFISVVREMFDLFSRLSLKGWKYLTPLAILKL